MGQQFEYFMSSEQWFSGKLSDSNDKRSSYWIEVPMSELLIRIYLDIQLYS